MPRPSRPLSSRSPPEQWMDDLPKSKLLLPWSKCDLCLENPVGVCGAYRYPVVYRRKTYFLWVALPLQKQRAQLFFHLIGDRSNTEWPSTEWQALFTVTKGRLDLARSRGMLWAESILLSDLERLATVGGYLDENAEE